MRHFSEEEELDYLLRKEIRRTIGHEPTDEEVKRYIDDQRRRGEAEDARRATEEQAATAETLRLERERQTILDIRRRKRSDPVDSPLISNLQVDLKSRQSANASNCQSGQFIGERSARLLISGDLEAFNFDGATFRHVTFAKDANLTDATMVGADLEDVTFEPGCNVSNVDFRQTHFDSVTIMPGCLIQGASFQLARFEKGISVEFDHNNLSGAAFAAPRRDRWFGLSRSYSTIAQVLNAILSMTYFALILIKLYLFRALGTVQQAAFERTPSAAMQGADFSRVTVFDFVFGSQWSSFALAFLIITYQALRLYLTVNIAPLIEAERQSGHTPLLVDFARLLRLQRLTSVLGWIALLVFLYEIYGLLTQEAILIPKTFHIVAIN